MSKKTVAVVTFPNADRFSSSFGKEYNFLTDIDNLLKGDTVVVDTVNGLTVAKFDKYDSLGFGETGKKMPTKWVIQKVDLDTHLKRVEAAKKAEKLKKAMEVKRKQAEEMQIYTILAQADPEMKKLLDEFKELQEVL